MTQIDSAWRFHLGDDARWSQAAFDDSEWGILNPTKDWNTQGIPKTAQFAWFRFRVKAPANTSSMVLELPTIHKSYQLFADGNLIAEVGTLPPGPAHNVIAAPRVFTVPIGSGPTPTEVTLALRTWQDPSLAGARSSRVGGNVYLGSADTVLEHFAGARAMDLLSDGALYTENLLSLVVGTSAFILFWLTRQRFYFWFALVLGCDVLFQPLDYASRHQAWDFHSYVYLHVLLDLLAGAVYILFVVDAIFPGRWKLILLPLAFTGAAELTVLLVLWHSVPLVFEHVAYCLGMAAAKLVLIWYLIRGWRAGNEYAPLLFFPIALETVENLLNNLGRVFTDFKVPWAVKIVPSEILVIEHPFEVGLDQVFYLVVLFAFLAILVYRFAHTSREEQRLASAMQAARDIQQRLVPIDLPSSGGLRIEIAYRAAEEVGGDFCQVLPRPDGSTLVAIGDVSGKGLRAAMLGAVAVGALRSLVAEQASPARVLERLNQAMLQRENPGFVTCLCLLVTAEGEIEVANAGHLPPYLNGEELPVESNLPLGIVSGLRYEQMSFTLPPSARLVLLSDGVVEARSRSGELFGFDRASRISRLDATEIAEQACRFGQEDDITVITLDWHSVIPAPGPG